MFLVVGVLLLLFAGCIAVKQPFVGRGETRGPAVDPERLRAHVRMLSETLSPRGYEDVENQRKCVDYLVQQLRDAGLSEVEEQTFTVSTLDNRNLEYVNVVARVGPPTGDVLVVGAHYDAYGGLPAADDNASGVAGVLELARLLAKDPPKTRVELVAYANEEPPYFRSNDMGSWHHAEALAKGGQRVRGMISVEMIGTFSDEKDSQKFPSALVRWLYPSTGNFIAVVGRLFHGDMIRDLKRSMSGATELPVESINAPRVLPGIDFSDHGSYWDHGFDAAMVTDTSMFRNPRYHTRKDTWDTLDYTRMAQVVSGLFVAVKDLTAQPSP